jgi:SAM-dependent methyltransferase
LQRRTARAADRHVLYELSVQEPGADLDFAERIYTRTRGKRPLLLREDFCGTAVLSCQWVTRRRANRALGVDLDPAVLAWGRRHHVARLGPDAASRLTLVEANVLDVQQPRADVTLAMNFSYWVFKTRPELLRYFRAAYRALKTDGVIVLDAFGGSESQVVLEEKTEYEDKGFTYVWDQADFNPINDEITCRIHFEFPDGTELRNAFTYHWRLWSLAEVCEALRDAGFRTADVYWEGDGDNGEGDGVFRLRRRAENSEGWIAYVVGVK